MALRDGMAALLVRTRRMVNDEDSTVWTDQDVQDTLDLHRLRVYREPLEVERTLTGGGAEYRVYHSRHTNYEAGTAAFRVEDAAGNQRGTADYSADYVNGVVTMAADQQGTQLYLSGWSYDVNAAAADLWEERAGQVASFYDARTGDHQLSRSQWHAHCQERAAHYRQLSRPVRVRSWSVGLLDD